MKATDFFRALDDSDLDPYETRYLMRVWRRGQCWEKVDRIAETTGMSRRQAYYARASLLEKGWLVEVIAAGRVAYSVTIPDCCVSAPDAQVVQDVHSEVHTMHEVVHDMHALPINRPKEDHPTKATAATATAAPQDDPIAELAEHFYRKTGFIPDPRRPMNELDWLTPLASILKMGGGDVEVAKTLITTSIDKAWSTLKGDGAPYPVHTPRSIVKFAANLAAAGKATTAAADDETIWQRALNAISRKDYSDDRLKAAIRAIGGSGRIASANGHDTDQLRRQLANEYRRIPTPA